MAKAILSKGALESNQNFLKRQANISMSIADILRQAQSESKSTAADIYEAVGEDVIINTEKPLTAREQGKVNRRLEKLIPVLLAVYLKKDNWSKKTVIDEYNISFYESGYALTDLTNDKTLFLGHPKKGARQAAFDRIHSSVLNDTSELALRRRVNARQIASTIRNGVAENKTWVQVTRDIDRVLGYRDANYKLTEFAINKLKKGELVKSRGQIYESVRIARTEMASIRNLSKVDSMLRAQAQGIDERLQKFSVLDDRTRPQSAAMDLQVSNELGQFRYPNGLYYTPGLQPIQWRINDRGDFAPWVEGIPDPTERTVRIPDSYKGDRDVDVITGPFKNFQSYADEFGLKVNRYGQRYTF
jgi:hypothetical protein